MKFALTEEQRELRSVLGDFLAKQAPLNKALAHADGGVAYPRAACDALAELAVLGVDTPVEHGGTGLGAAELAVVSEQLGAVAYPGPFLSSFGMAAGVLQQAVTAGSAVARPLLEQAVTGAVLAVAWPESEPVRAATASGALTVTGTARRVLQAPDAGVLLVFAQGADGLVLLSVAAERATIVELPVIDPTRPIAQVRFDAAAADLVAAEADDISTRAWERTQIALAAEALGGAGRCLQMASDYARERQQFGQAIGSRQGIKHRLADVLVELELATSAVYAAAAHFSAGDRSACAVSVPLAALAATEVYSVAASANIQVHGGIGFTWEHPAHLHVKRAQTDRLLLGGPRARLREIYDHAGTTLG